MLSCGWKVSVKDGIPILISHFFHFFSCRVPMLCVCLMSRPRSCVSTEWLCKNMVSGVGPLTWAQQAPLHTQHLSNQPDLWGPAAWWWENTDAALLFNANILLCIAPVMCHMQRRLVLLVGFFTCNIRLKTSWLPRNLVVGNGIGRGGKNLKHFDVRLITSCNISTMKLIGYL